MHANTEGTGVAEGTGVETENVLAKSVTMTIKQAHVKFGHCHEDKTRKIAKQLRVEISRGTLGPCDVYRR
jgi:hypothetical protein